MRTRSTSGGGSSSQPSSLTRLPHQWDQVLEALCGHEAESYAGTGRQHVGDHRGAEPEPIDASEEVGQSDPELGGDQLAGGNHAFGRISRGRWDLAARDACRADGDDVGERAPDVDPDPETSLVLHQRDASNPNWDGIGSAYSVDENGSVRGLDVMTGDVVPGVVALVVRVEVSLPCEAVGSQLEAASVTAFRRCSSAAEPSSPRSRMRSTPASRYAWPTPEQDGHDCDRAPHRGALGPRRYPGKCRCARRDPTEQWSVSVHTREAGHVSTARRVTRLGRPDDIAAMVTFLLSDDGSLVSGQIISVDGGTEFGR